MANRPKRRRKPTSQPNTFTEDSGIDLGLVENFDNEDKTYRNNPKKRKPFVQYLSLKTYKPKIDKYFTQ